eukprot:GGOE01041525.1.p1 GENE.GGOE01041525.1~~GGOE01041525.1.p1  ORF type:complete len:362 (+),score=51.65 GGOE01041525.1:79-1164(+)
MYTTVARFDRAHQGNGIWSAAAADNHLVTGSIDGSLNLWRLAGREMTVTKTWSHALAVVSLSLAGNVQATSLMNGSVFISNASNGEVIECMELEPGEVGQVSVREDGELVAIAAGKHGVLLYHVPSHTQQFLSCDASEDDAGSIIGPCNCVTFGQDGEWLIAGCRNGIVHVWSCIKTGTEIAANRQAPAAPPKLHGRWRSDFSAVTAAAISCDGRYLALAHSSGVVLMWTLPLLELSGHLTCSASDDCPKKGAIRQVPAPLCLCFAPNALFVAVGFADGKVKLYHAPQKELVYTFSEHQLPVMQLLFIPNTDRLLSAGDDGTLVTYSCHFPKYMAEKSAGQRQSPVCPQPPPAALVTETPV